MGTHLQSLSNNEYLTFLLDGEEFGVDILSVQEIRGWSIVTEIPNTPSYLKGVINLRGIIIPIVDLRGRFNCKSSEYTATTVVIVLQGIVHNKRSTVGVVVDAVSDVYRVEHADVKTMPDFGSHIESSFISGMATVDEKIIILLDSNKLLDVEEIFSKATHPSSITVSDNREGNPVSAQQWTSEL